MFFFKSKQKHNYCQEWFDFKVLIIIKIVFLFWGLAILGIFLKMSEITRGFKIIIPIATILFIASIFSKSKNIKEKGIALFLFVMTLFLIVKFMDIFYATKYFSGVKLQISLLKNFLVMFLMSNNNHS